MSQVLKKTVAKRTPRPRETEAEREAREEREEERFLSSVMQNADGSWNGPPQEEEWAYWAARAKDDRDRTKAKKQMVLEVQQALDKFKAAIAGHRDGHPYHVTVGRLLEGHLKQLKASEPAKEAGRV